MASETAPIGPIRIFALAVVYFALAWVALGLKGLHDAVPVIAPATGLAVAALVHFGRRAGFAVLIGALGAYLAAGIPSWVAAMLSLGALLTALAGAGLLMSAPDFRRTFARGREVFAFVGLAVVCAPLVGASIGVGGSESGSARRSEYFWSPQPPSGGCGSRTRTGARWRWPALPS